MNERKETDFYYTIESTAVAEFKDRGSKFLAYSFPVKNTDDFKKYLQELKKEQDEFNAAAKIIDPNKKPIDVYHDLQKQGESLDHWYSYYGYFKNGGNSLSIGPLAKKNNDSLAVYRAGASWDDYEMDTTTQWGITSTFSLLARFKNPENYVSCAYSYYGQTAQIYSVVNGVSTNIATSPTLPTKYDEAWKDVKAGIRVQGSEVYCLEDGVVVLKANLPDIPRVGTVGIDAWDQNTEASPHTITSLTVRSLGGE